VFTHPIDHWLELVVFLRHAVRLHLNDYLVRVINRGDADI
jgi:hypothetical protein